MSGDQLNLDAVIERNEIAWEVSADEWVENRDKCDAFATTANDVPALVAEVRRLRAQVARSDEWLAAANAVIRERAIDEIAEGIG